MTFTFNDLEGLSGVARNTLLQWKHRDFLDGEFNDELAMRAMWLGELSQRGVPVGQAFELYVEALREEGTILVAHRRWAEMALRRRIQKDAARSSRRSACGS